MDITGSIGQIPITRFSATWPTLSKRATGLLGQTIAFYIDKAMRAEDQEHIARYHPIDQ